MSTASDNYRAPDCPILTERLSLRPFTMADLDAFHAMRSDPEHLRYVPFGPMTREEVAKVIENRKDMAALDEEGSGITLGIERRDTGELIGDLVLFHYAPQHRSAELGYALATGQHGHGFATEAARAMVAWGFGEGGLHRIQAKLDARNVASARVLERLGFRREAHLREDFLMRGEWTDTFVYGLLDREWRG